MAKRSTIIFKFNKQVGRKRNKQNEDFLRRCLTDNYSPSVNTINNIMSFARAYRYEKSDSLGAIEMVIN